jgi:hypothetical protein
LTVYTGHAIAQRNRDPGKIGIVLVAGAEPGNDAPGALHILGSADRLGVVGVVVEERLVGDRVAAGGSDARQERIEGVVIRHLVAGNAVDQGLLAGNFLDLAGILRGNHGSGKGNASHRGGRAGAGCGGDQATPGNREWVLQGHAGYLLRIGAFVRIGDPWFTVRPVPSTGVGVLLDLAARNRVSDGTGTGEQAFG